MKHVNFSTLLLLTAALCIGGSGCKHRPVSPTPIPNRQVTVPRSSNPADIAGAPTLPGDGTPSATRLPSNADGSTPLGDRPPGDLSAYIQDRETFRKDIIYFDLDKYNVKASELPKLQEVVTYLKGQPGLSVLVEGHCDERGTPEYNRALGDRRALSGRESLIQLGLPGERIHTISYGEDKPADPGHTEAAFAKNRRDEFVLLRPKAGAGTAETQ